MVVVKIINGVPWRDFMSPFIMSFTSILPNCFKAYPLATKGASDTNMLKINAGMNFFQETFVSPIP